MYVLPAGSIGYTEHWPAHRGWALQHRESIFVSVRDTHTVNLAHAAELELFPTSKWITTNRWEGEIQPQINALNCKWKAILDSVLSGVQIEIENCLIETFFKCIISPSAALFFFLHDCSLKMSPKDSVRWDYNFFILNLVYQKLLQDWKWNSCAKHTKPVIQILFWRY